MHSWYTRPMAALDLETTGLDVTCDRIVTAALWRLDPATGTRNLLEWLVDPGIEIPEQATAVHGISTDQARRRGRPPVEMLTQLIEQLKDCMDEMMPLVVYNAPYDLTLFHSELERHGLVLDYAGQLRVIDPLVLDLHVDPDRGQSRRLSSVCSHYGVPLPEESAHSASADALAAGRLAWRLGKEFDELAGMGLAELHQAQVRWRVKQAAARQSRLRRTTDPFAVVNGSWPFLRTPVAA